MKKLIAAALLSLTAFTFIAGAVSVTGASSAYAKNGADDGAGHDKGDDHGGNRGGR